MSINKENIIRNAVLACFELFTLFSVVFFTIRREGDRILLCAVTILLLLLPMAVERIFQCRLTLCWYILCMFYAIGAMLGHSWKLYYLLPGWDKLLHITGGIVFAAVGVYLPRLITGKDMESIFMTALFALCLSIAVSAIWEFAEYGMDRIFAMDMQSDTVVHSINSYILGDEPGVLGSIDQIQEISINGQDPGFGGYLDLGLIDTMNDMIVESAGAFLYVLIYARTGGKYQAFRPYRAVRCEKGAFTRKEKQYE